MNSSDRAGALPGRGGERLFAVIHRPLGTCGGRDLLSPLGEEKLWHTAFW